jgi:hypothetical protein
MPKDMKFPLHNAYSRFLYAFTLMFLPIEAVKKLWQKVPLEMEGELWTGKKLFSYLWVGKECIPSEYINQIWVEIEDVFLSCDRYVRDDFIQFLKRRDVVEAGMIFRFLEPVLIPMFKSVDIKFAILKFVLAALHNTCTPKGLFVTEGFSKNRNGMIAGYQVFTLDKTFTFKFTKSDGDLAFAPLTQYLPLRFGTTSYDMSRMVAECQSVFERINPELKPRIENSCFYLDNEKYGKISSFKDFLKEKGITLTKIYPPDCDVVVVERDYYCSTRKRIVLRAGCAYGAPVWIIELGYLPNGNTLKEPLQSLKRELTMDSPSTYTLLQPKHEALISSFSESVRFTYNKTEQSIFANDHFVTSGIQAKILREILLAHRDKNRTEFERREFIQSPEFVSDPYNTGFNTRLERIIECMNKTCPDVKIEKHARGKFKLAPLTAISFTDV